MRMFPPFHAIPNCPDALQQRICGEKLDSTCGARNLGHVQLAMIWVKSKMKIKRETATWRSDK
jgi:hypothetical protein